jgi:transcriptional regulator GlxA family with amidase domain
LERFFLKWTGQTPKGWLAAHRYSEAAQLLSLGVSVKEVAQLSGYKYASSFSREFHKKLKQSCVLPPMPSVES